MAKHPPARPPADAVKSSAQILPGEGVRDVRTELDRIIFFSDAVFAIAITLLALDIHFPDFAVEPSDAILWQAVLAILPRFGIYALSFVVIGIYWVSHHRSFRVIERYDSRLIWLNLLQLMFIAFLPVSSTLLGHYPLHQPVLILYSVNVIAAGIMQYLTFSHATRNHHLVDPDLDDRLTRYVRLNTIISMMAFVVTIGVSFYSPRVALLIPILVLIIYVPLAPLFQRVLLRLIGPD